jgi:glutamyl-tRNA synthetase
MAVPDASRVRVRIAPSPTGFAHLGTASTALYNVLFARANGGTFVLRIDDTDVERNRPEYEAVIYESLHWLGLDWDEGPDKGGPDAPYRQSERLDLYKRDASRLLSEGKAYRCYCTPEELDAERKQAQAEKRPYKYSRRCLTDPPKDRTEFTVRFKVPGGEVRFTDMIRGEMTFDAGLIGDFILVKSDGYPTYQFASPVDDAAMKISHVIRGEEHLSNTPYQLMIVDALGYDRPVAYAHMPLILAKDGAKLSKRKHPESNLMLYREKGYLPEALINYLALLGWNPGTAQEIFSFDDLVRLFSFDRVQHAGGDDPARSAGREDATAQPGGRRRPARVPVDRPSAARSGTRCRGKDPRRHRGTEGSALGSCFNPRIPDGRGREVRCGPEQDVHADSTRRHR